MRASGVSLVDANVWLALAVDGHAHHATARTWFDTQTDDSCAFCRVTQLALLRHLTNSRIMSSAVQTQAAAWRTYEAFLGDPRVLFLDETAGVTAAFKTLTQNDFPGHERWTDAYLAAFATAASANLVTFDRGLRGGATLKIELLDP